MKEALKKFMGRVEKENYYTPGETTEPNKMPKFLEQNWKYVIDKFKTKKEYKKVLSK